MISPMMQHYLSTKEEYKDCILFYRLGDFYEMFFDDAITVSRELELTLTGKDCGLEERAPMCGVPYHAADTYLNRLVDKGYKVAVAEQMEDPKLAKGLVKREVIRVVTPGTNISETALDETRNNYLMSIVYIDKGFGIAAADVSTGDFMVTEVDSLGALQDEIFRYVPSEIICNDALYISGMDIDSLKTRMNLSVSALENSAFDDRKCREILARHFRVASADSLGLSLYPAGMVAAGALIIYLQDTIKGDLAQMTAIHPYNAGGFMLIDTFTQRNLELLETMREKQKRGSLLWVLDHTKTAMGARLLRCWIEQPLLRKKEILKRQEAVEELFDDMISREELREYLNPVYDLERLIGRIAFRSASPRDLIALKSSLQMLPAIAQAAGAFSSGLMKELCGNLDQLTDIADLIERSINDDPPILVREGGIIKEGYNEEVDRLRKAKTEGKSWLAGLEAEERERTGIKNLKIRYNKVFGYFFEVTNSFLNMVPDDFIRRQTLTGSERFTTARLKEMEETILGAEDRLSTLEYNLFTEVRDLVGAETSRVQATAKAVAAIDVLLSLAHAAYKNRYVRPDINEKGIIEISAGRHPVVELMQKNELFVSNDTMLDTHDNRMAIITGPNMAGKSTYMRQVALIVLMAQIGSFVPANSANIGICDRIFTRVGASDDLASGQSTFMVEMNEVANILRNATKKSLLILDEIGRGTSTFDGMAIAWAVVEYISNTKNLGARTLFATHYHEMTELEGALPGVKNYCIAVREQGDTIIFLRKIIRGGADKSYGIQVARLAGVPEAVLLRATELVEELTDEEITLKARQIAETSGRDRKKPVRRPDDVDRCQLSLFETAKDDDFIKEIKEMDLGNMTPLDALNTLYRIQAGLNNRYSGEGQ